MQTRRTFLATAALGTAAVAGHPLLARAASGNGPGGLMPTRGEVKQRALPRNEQKAGGKYRPDVRLGLGGVAIGNGWAPATDEQSEATLQAAWDTGARLFDTSPWYGLGLSERRFGHVLHRHPADAYVLSTKVGRLLLPTGTPPRDLLWKNPSPFSYRYDYSAAGTRRSIEDSLQRLGVSSIDIVFIHDLSPDNEDMGERWTEYFDQAAKGAMPELTRMREEGLIKAWGFGVNRPEPALRAVEVADPDIFLLATQYSLVDHEQALEKTFPALEKRGISVIVGAPLNFGFLAGRDRFNYTAEIPAAMAEKRRRIAAVAAEHGIDMRTAALQFAAAHPVVSAVIPGARTQEQMRANAESMRVAIPSAFWEQLKQDGVIARTAPVPAAA